MEYMINGTPYHLSDGDILFMPPSTVSKRLVQKNETGYFALNFVTDAKIDLPLYIPCGLSRELYARNTQSTRRKHAKKTRLNPYMIGFSRKNADFTKREVIFQEVTAVVILKID